MKCTGNRVVTYRSAWRSGWGLRAVYVAAAVACFALVGQVQGQETATDYAEPRVDRVMFTEFCQSLGVDPDQRSIIDVLFSDYSDAVTAATEEADARAEAAGRKRVADALAGKATIAPDELRRLRVEVLKAYEGMWPALDEAFEQLFFGVETILLPGQHAAFSESMPDIRRRVLLHPRQMSGQHQEYAGDGVDLLQLVEEAMQPGSGESGAGGGAGGAGGELEGISSQSLAAELNTYEGQLDVILRETAPAGRAGRLHARIASIQKDSSATRAEQKSGIERWKLLYQLNQETAERIGQAAAASLGAEAQLRWRERCDRANFPWLFQRRKPDRQIEWIRERIADQDRVAAAEKAYADFATRRRALLTQAVNIMVRARLEHGAVLYAMMDPTTLDDRVRRDLYEQLLRNTGDLSGLESASVSAIEATLTDPQRVKLREAMKGPDRAAERR